MGRSDRAARAAPPAAAAAAASTSPWAGGRGGRLPRFDAGIMERAIDDQAALKAEVYGLFAGRPDLLVAEEEGLTKEQHRALVRACLRALLDAGHRPLSLLATDLRRYYYLGELLALVDLSLAVKMGVQYSLWGGSVLSLGTERHRRQYFEAIDTFALPGCFAMTELRHGSNVAALQTEAVLDLASDEWVVHTPDDGAIKWWIGNAAEDGRAATVFARLKAPAPDGSGALRDHGVHAFVVPLRDAAGACLPGVEIKDCGYKVGLNGVDNGAIRFTRVRIPRTALLDRFASVDAAGRYASPLPSPARRFAATLGELTGGRVGLVASSLGVLKGAATIAVRYGAARRQFGPPGAPEVAVLDYPSLQLKLMPMVASAYVLHFAKRRLVDAYAEARRTRDEAATADVHCLSAGLKAYVTAYTAGALSVAREACGGHGYAAVNRLGALRSDHDIFQTFEGDNTVLLQQVAGLLLRQYGARFRGPPLAATAAYLRAWAAGALPANPFLAHDTSDAHLRDPGFLVAALRYRSGRLLHTLAARLRRHTARAGEFAAWSRCLPHVLALARAHVEAVALDAALAGAGAVADADCRAALRALVALWALDRIQHDETAVFANDDYLSPEKAKAVRKAVERLAAATRALAVPLVDAWGIPDAILRAPIGLAASAHDPYGDYIAAAGFGESVLGGGGGAPTAAAAAAAPGGAGR